MIQNKPTHLHSHLPLPPRTNPRKQSQKRVQATAHPTSDSGSIGKVTAHRTDRAAAANMGLNESGGAVLRRTVFRIFEQWCFVESVVLKCPAFVKPRNVMPNIKTTIMTSFTRHYKDKKLVDISMTEIESLINDKTNQAIVAEYVYQRLYNRFLKIFDFKGETKVSYEKIGKTIELNEFNEEFKNGFLIMTSCSLLIETFASFLAGQNETPRGKSADMFNNVFEYAELKGNELKVFKNSKFYSKIRCGLLHQGETYGKFKITRKGANLLDNDTIDAYLFLKYLNQLLLTYKDDLTKGKWDSQEWDACRLKIRYITANAK